MSQTFQIACLAWLFFTMFLVSKIKRASRIIINGEVYYSARSMQISVELLAFALLVGMAIF